MSRSVRITALLLLLLCSPWTADANAAVSLTPSSQTKPVGGSAVLQSIVSGVQSPTYKWQKNGQWISATSSALFFTGLTLEDAGDYTVYVYAGDGTSAGAASARLNVRPLPVVTISPSVVNLIEGQSIVLNSSITATGSIVSYRWYRNANVISGATSGNFTRTSALSDNAAIFQLRVEDEIGGVGWSNVSTAHIVPNYPLTILQNIAPTADPILGESVTYQVRASGNASLTFNWYVWTTTGIQRLAKTEVFSATDPSSPYGYLEATSTFSFQPTRQEDLSKVFAAVVDGGSEHDSSDMSVVNVHHAPPIFVAPAQGQGFAGTFAMFSCFLAYAEDNPTFPTPDQIDPEDPTTPDLPATGRIRWYKNGTPINDGGKYNIYVSGDYSMLLVNELATSDGSNQYHCRSLDLDWDTLYRDSAAVGINVTTIDPVAGFCPPHTVPRGDTCVPLSDPLAPASGTDSDGDGFTDAQEAELGTSATDAGSMPATLQSPAYALWNGFLGMLNILELVNRAPQGGDDVAVVVDLYSISGEQVNSLKVKLRPGQQRDIILNDMAGFVADSYGLVKLSFSGPLDGRLFFYRPEPAAPGTFSFAFANNLTNGTYGRSLVGFNTMQPSTNPRDAANAVLNWLSIVNLDDATRSFQLSTFDMNGDLLQTKKISVPAFGRVDVDGGHVSPGLNRIGMHEIIPYRSDAPYVAQLMRYGTTVMPDNTPSFAFAFPLRSRPGIGESVQLPISSRFKATNWLEIANVLDKKVSVEVEFRNSAGHLQERKTLTLRAFQQIHLLASEYLGAEEIGSAILTPHVAESIVAQSMLYFRDGIGSISSMYGTQHQEASAQAVTGSYNLYLGMENYTRISNASSKTLKLDVKVEGFGGTLSTQSYSIPSFGSIELPLYDSAQFGTSPDSYGMIRLIPKKKGKLLAETIRVRKQGLELEYVAPTNFQ